VEIAFFLLVFLAIIGMTVAVILLVVTVIRRPLAPFASHYATNIEPAGQRFTHQTIRFGVVRFRNCVTVIIGPAGLYLRTWVATQPLLVPWSAMLTARGTMLYLKPAVELVTNAPGNPCFTVPAYLFEPMRPYLAAAARAAAVRSA
jgi:hypothetical protein